MARPLGGIFILKQLGFVEEGDSLILKQLNPKLLQSELARFQSILQMTGAVRYSFSKYLDLYLVFAGVVLVSCYLWRAIGRH